MRDEKDLHFGHFAQIYYAKRGIVSVAKLKNWFQSELMLDLFGKKYGGNMLSSGLTRRDILRIGSIGAGGLALPEVLRQLQADPKQRAALGRYSRQRYLHLFQRSVWLRQLEQWNPGRSIQA